MNKKVKGLILGVGIPLGVLIVGVSVAYGFLGTPPKLARDITAVEELLPQDAVSYVTFSNIDALAKLYGNSKMKRLARKLGIEEDFENLDQVKKLNDRTNGKFWNILGKRFVYATYAEDGEKEKLLVTEPRWNVRTLWRVVLGKGSQSESNGIPYSVFTDGSAAAFAGGFFWYSTNEDLLLSALEVASSNAKDEKTFPVSEVSLIYGLTRKDSKHLTFDEFRWSVYEKDKSLEAGFELDDPGGVLGDFISGIKSPADYSKIPDDAALFVNLAGVDPYKAWKAATAIARTEGTETVLASVEMEKPITTLATDIGDEVFFIMQGWNTDLWYGPANWLISAKVSSDQSSKAWESVANWLFSTALTDTTLEYRQMSYRTMGFGEDLPPISYLSYNSRLTLSSDTTLVPWILDAWSSGSTIDNSREFKTDCRSGGIDKPVAYINWPLLKQALKEYLLYAGDRTSGFTPADVEAKIFPLLDGLELSSILVDTDKDGETLSFTLKGVKQVSKK